MTSIRRQLLVGLLTELLALLLLGGAGLYLYARRALTAQFDSTLSAEARGIAGAVGVEESGTIILEGAASAAVTPAQPKARPLSVFEIRRADGSVLARSSGLGSDLPDPSAAPGASAYRNLVLPDGRKARAVRLTFTPHSEAEEDHPLDPAAKPPRQAPAAAREVMTIVFARDRSSIDQSLHTLITALFFLAGLIAAGVVVIVTVGVRRALGPLQRVAEEASAIDASRLGHRFATKNVPAELGPVCMRLNDLLERLESAFLRERRFTANVAHELRTPIAELRSLAEVAIRWPNVASGEISKSFHDVLEISRQMEGTVATLLELARVEKGSAAASYAAVDLGDLIATEWRLLEPEALRRSLSHDMKVPLGVSITSDRTMLSCILRNVLSNAVQYTPEAGRISCRVVLGQEAVEIFVENTDHSLTADDLPHLPEPFWRKDAARSDSAHSGLGLSLVAAYAHALGGTMSANMIDHRLSIAVKLPTAPGPAVAAP